MRIERSDKVPAAALIGFLLLCGGAKSMLEETAKAEKPRGGLGSVTTLRKATRPPAATDMTDLTKQDAVLVARVIRTVTMTAAEGKFLPAPFSMARFGDRSSKFLIQ